MAAVSGLYAWLLVGGQHVLVVAERFARAGFAYIDAVVDGDSLRLCRLRYSGSASQWGFAIYRTSHDDYEDSDLPTGYPISTAEEALDVVEALRRFRRGMRSAQPIGVS